MSCPFGYGSSAPLPPTSHTTTPGSGSGALATPSSPPAAPPAEAATAAAAADVLAVGEKGTGKGEKVYYPDYLQLGKLLKCQEPLSWKKGSGVEPSHDELLFITIHQTYELWFKQLLHEMDSVRELFQHLKLGATEIGLALHRLRRMMTILKVLVEQIAILETMTPHEFLDFRDVLGSASGFQSFQFRLLEIKLGVRHEQRPNGDRWVAGLAEEHQRLINAARQEPSLFDYVERWLKNMPFREFRGYDFRASYAKATSQFVESERAAVESSPHIDENDRRAALESIARTENTFRSVHDRAVHDEFIAAGMRRLGFRATGSALFLMLYSDQPMLQLPASLLRVLVDVDNHLNQWRYRHAQMVHSMIGIKMGTGGSLGFQYLQKTVDRCRVFSDLANMSTLLIPRKLLPTLPHPVGDQLKYFHAIEQHDRTLFEMGGGGEEITDWSFC